MKLVEFIIASSLLTLIPGPDILFVLTQSILHGKRAGISVALGLCSGLFFHTAAAALGLSLIIASSPALFAGIKYAGICYLLWMGYASLRAYQKTARGKVPSPGNILSNSRNPFQQLVPGKRKPLRPTRRHPALPLLRTALPRRLRIILFAGFTGSVSR